MGRLGPLPLYFSYPIKTEVPLSSEMPINGGSRISSSYHSNRVCVQSDLWITSKYAPLWTKHIREILRHINACTVTQHDSKLTSKSLSMLPVDTRQVCCYLITVTRIQCFLKYISQVFH